MVQINHSLGANGLTNLGSAKKVQVSGENDKKPQTVIDELVIMNNGEKVYDDGKIDKIIYIWQEDGKTRIYTLDDTKEK